MVRGVLRNPPWLYSSSRPLPGTNALDHEPHCLQRLPWYNYVGNKTFSDLDLAGVVSLPVSLLEIRVPALEMSREELSQRRLKTHLFGQS